MASSSYTARQAAIDAVLGHSWFRFAISVVLVVFGAIFLQPRAVVYAAAAALTIVWLGAVLASLRHYNPWLSWLAWLLPFIPVLAVLEPIRTGAISIGTVVFVYALAAAIMFGGFAVAGKRIRTWLGG
jgi:hypothetical protein